MASDQSSQLVPIGRSAAATTARVANAVVIMAIVAAVVIDEWSWFTLHPVGMIVWMWASTEAVVSMQSGRNVAPNERKAQTQYHWVLQSVASLALLFAYYVIYSNKENRGKLHLQSWHAWAGISTVVAATLQTGLGLLMYNLPTLLPAKIGGQYALHRLLGYLVHTCSTVSILLAFWSKWFLRSAISDYVHLVCVIGIVVAYVAAISGVDRRTFSLFVPK